MVNTQDSAEKSYWGWIPILTHSFYLTCKDSEQHKYYIKDYEEINDGDIDAILSENYSKEDMSYIDAIILSDRPRDILLRNKHRVELQKLNNNKVVKFRVKIKSPVDYRTLVDGTAEIQSNGLVLYQINTCEGEDFNCVSQMHKIIRDIFHKHDHHSSDLLLPPVKVNEQSDAICDIMKLYLLKLMEYKRISTKVRPKDSIEDLHRALGEIEYAKVFLNINMVKFEEIDSSKFMRSIDSFSKSFEVLLERLRDRIEFANNYMLNGLAIYLLAFTILLSRPELIKILQQFLSRNIDYFINIIIIFLFSLGFGIATYFTWSSASMLMSTKNL